MTEINGGFERDSGARLDRARDGLGMWVETKESRKTPEFCGEPPEFVFWMKGGGKGKLVGGPSLQLIAEPVRSDAPAWSRLTLRRWLGCSFAVVTNVWDARIIGLMEYLAIPYLKCWVFFSPKNQRNRGRILLFLCQPHTISATHQRVLNPHSRHEPWGV